jgi:hypothetical protein
MRERIRRLIDDRTRMLAAMSHDLRTAAHASAPARGDPARGRHPPPV